MVDTAASSSDDDDDDDNDDNEADTQTHKPPEKRRRSEPPATNSRQTETTRSRELRSTGRIEQQMSGSNLPRQFNSAAAAAGLTDVYCAWYESL